jgi:hypothetical protein
MPEKKVTKKVAAKKVVSKKTAAKKVVAKKTPAKKAATKRTKQPSASLEAIEKLAYENHLRRVEHGLEGDAESDWLEAENALKH